jgi:hypothetical protein
MVSSNTSFNVGNYVLNTALQKEGVIISILHYINNEGNSYIVKYNDGTYGYVENKELSIIITPDCPR